MRKLNGTVLSLLIGGGGNNNYWHWLYNVLPRLKIISEQNALSKIDYFLFPGLSQKFQNETLDNLNIPQRKRISSVKFRHLKADKLIIIDDPILVTGNATEDIQRIPIWILEWLKSSFLKDNYNYNNKNKRIYIDRSSSGITNKEDRFVSNESEVRNYLIKNNFTPVKLHELNFEKQISLFNNAEFVVGLHGAGFANTVFCQPKTKIIEFRNVSLLPVIENLAVSNNLDYYSIISKEKHNLKFPSQQGSIYIPISSLEKIIEK
jgi:capsular polysaccharide biosynthesis protein